MNYVRGRQVVIHDPRLETVLSDAIGPPSDELWMLGRKAIAPKAWWNLEVDPKKHKVSEIFAAVALRANIAKMTGIGELDALHIMAHGTQGAIQLGSDWLHKPTMSALGKIAGVFRFVIIHSCLVGRPPQGTPAFMTFMTFGGSQFAHKAAALTKSTIVVARQLQYYSVKKHADLNRAELDFGKWDGPVDVYKHGLPVETHNQIVDDAFNLEKLIFGNTK
ncbi:MAG: hypothetical protein FJX20_11460 [Alphaproteobacteria bacterium]|nr:hypothetical protein [Alphaproteobacteria bacterium]